MHKCIGGMVVAAMVLAGCGPYPREQLVDIGPNETAFIVPLEGDGTAQETADASSLKNAKQIFAKRVSLPLRTRKVGRGWWNYEWIPTLRVVTVDRTEVTRNFIATSPNAEKNGAMALAVQSSEPVKFFVALTVTASILEDHAHKFLYSYRGKSLAEVVDHNVRSFLQSYFGHAFADLPLQECQRTKAGIFDSAVAATEAEFEQFGVTINVVGNIGGLDYINTAVQTAIDGQYLAILRQAAAVNKQEAQEVRNETRIILAELERRRGEALHMAGPAMEFATALDIALLEAEAMQKAVAHFRSLPETILDGGGDNNGTGVLLSVPKP